MGERFFGNSAVWLSVFVLLEEAREVSIDPMTSALGSGRPPSTFETSIERTKRGETEELWANSDKKELSFATQMSL